MKILGVLLLAFVCVTARGSGPYLPSGWKPDGPTFYLPSEDSKPQKESVKEVVFTESEASGSDFLREYGPPKLQEVSQDFSQQGLPDVINEQLFIAPETKSSDVKDNANVSVITEEKVEVNAEVRTSEKPVVIIESESVAATESIANIGQVALQVNDETTTWPNVVEPVDTVESDYTVEPSVDITESTEKVIIDVSIQSENLTVGDVVVETQQLINEKEEPLQSVSQGEETENIDIIPVTRGSDTSRIDIDKSDESATSIIQKADFDDISTTAEEAKTVDSTVDKVEEVKINSEVADNIPEQIVSLENEIKSKQVEAIYVVPAVNEAVFGSLDQLPEGFLEYGPPGFHEYGPPKEDLKDNTIDEKIPETHPIDSFARKRRFSPKFGL